MRLHRTSPVVALAVGFATALAVTADAQPPSRPAALPASAFRTIELPDTATPSPTARPSPTSLVILEPPPPLPTRAPVKIPQPKVQSEVKAVAEPKVTGTVSVREGARIAKAYARSRLSASQYECILALWKRESGWRWNALNSSSGAYGIPQALPGSKMKSAGSDWKTNPITQVKWGLRYVNGRYGSACGAWSFFRSHGWY